MYLTALLVRLQFQDFVNHFEPKTVRKWMTRKSVHSVILIILSSMEDVLESQARHHAMEVGVHALTEQSLISCVT